MADDTSATAGPAPDPVRPKRPPPTIDLEPTSSETHPAPAEAVAEGVSETASESHPHGAAEPDSKFESKFESEPERPAVEEAAAAAPPPQPASRSAVSPWVIAPFSGAVAAALVIGVGWMLGWPQVAPPSAEPQLATVVDGLNARLNGLEARVGKSDSAAAARVDALDKALAAVRSDVSSVRTQADKAMASVNDAKALPRDGTGAVDLAALNARIDQIERASRNQSAAIAQDTKEIAEAKPADDLPLRRVIAAALLDVAVRHGDAYASELATAKSLAADPNALKPLETFAASGVPSPAALDRDLLTIVPKLAPPAAETPTGNSIIDRLQSAKLVRIERTDGAGTDRGAVVARITAAALRNDFADARRELSAMAPADRAAAQAWLDKTDMRDAALAASRQFADAAMTALAKPPQ